VPPGASVPVEVRFRRIGNARCNQDMELSLEGAVAQNGLPLTLRPIAFVPEKKDT
jgi:hypothetical protein